LAGACNRVQPCRRSSQKPLLRQIPISTHHEGHEGTKTMEYRSGGVLEYWALKISLLTPTLRWSVVMFPQSFVSFVISSWCISINPTPLPEPAAAPARVPARANVKAALLRRTKPE